MTSQGGTGTLTIADGGFVSVSGGLKLGLLADSADTINIGGAMGMAAAAAGTLDSATLQVGDGAGTINFNHTAAGYVFGAEMSMASLCSRQPRPIALLSGAAASAPGDGGMATATPQRSSATSAAS